MSSLLVYEFLEKAQYCKDLDELSCLMQKVFNQLGFPMWAYQTEADSYVNQKEPVLVHNFPKKWEEYYILNNCTEIDPVIKYGGDYLNPFQWSDLTKNLKLSSTELAYQDIANQHGMLDGLAVPIIGAYGKKSMISLSTDINANELPSMLRENRDQIIALSFAFHSIAKDFIKEANQKGDVTNLTAREKECLHWIVYGKTAWEIGMILNISKNTVIFHVENLKRKFNVNNRHHLIVKAICSGVSSI